MEMNPVRGIRKAFQWAATPPKHHYTLGEKLFPNGKTTLGLGRVARTQERIMTIGGALCVGTLMLVNPAFGVGAAISAMVGVKISAVSAALVTQACMWVGHGLARLTENVLFGEEKTIDRRDLKASGRPGIEQADDPELLRRIEEEEARRWSAYIPTPSASSSDSGPSLATAGFKSSQSWSKDHQIPSSGMITTPSSGRDMAEWRAPKGPNNN
jgi:hypothetical protein